MIFDGDSKNCFEISKMDFAEFDLTPKRNPARLRRSSLMNFQVLYFITYKLYTFDTTYRYKL